jgi:hypothetical protein
VELLLDGREEAVEVDVEEAETIGMGWGGHEVRSTADFTPIRTDKKMAKGEASVEATIFAFCLPMLAGCGLCGSKTIRRLRC